MKAIAVFVTIVVSIAGALFLGCDLATLVESAKVSHPANHVVINEVFTLPPTMKTYSWIEIYNPTSERIAGLHRWSLSYTTRLSYPGVLDTTFRVTARLGSGYSSIPDTLEPGRFLVLISDSIRFYDHTNLGPGKGTATTFFPVMQMTDSTSLFVSYFSFWLQEAGEIVLTDASGTPVDVVRYGNYSPPSPDSHPGNQSAGTIPVWCSLSRYAGAYSTDNTANDFYMEAKPIPMWTSQRSHP